MILLSDLKTMIYLRQSFKIDTYTVMTHQKELIISNLLFIIFGES